MRSATLTDVAREAGVSIQTVSRVINGGSETSAATRARVLQAVAALDYRPNAIARGLRARQTRTIGVVVPDIANPFFPEVVRGAQSVASAAGYAVILANAEEDATREGEALQLLEERRVDGLIACSPRQPDMALAAALRRCGAAVVVNRVVPPEVAGVVRVDFIQAGRLAVEHLTARGRSRIGMLTAPASSRGGQERLEGFLAACRVHGLGQAEGSVQTGAPTVDGGAEAAAALLAARPGLDGLFCYNDLMAAGAMRVLKAQGRRIPGDVAVIGCDDIAFAAMFSPALTTLQVDKAAIGAEAMRLLLERIGGRRSQPHIVFQPSLVTRESAP